jgi:hypothetical protein
MAIVAKRPIHNKWPFEEPVPMFSGQAHLLAAAAADPTNISFLQHETRELRGPLAIEAFRRAVNQVLARHHVLRARFPLVAGERVQTIAATMTIEVPVIDYDGPALEATRMVVGRAFDLERGPLVRVVLFRRSAGEHLLVTVVHHAVCDGRSMALLHAELAEIYGALRRGESPKLPELPLQYADFAGWMQELSADARVHEAFWRQHVSRPSERLSLCGERPGGEPGRSLEEAVISAAEWSALRARMAALNVTPFAALLAVFTAAMAQESRREEIVVGFPLQERYRAEFRSLIGYFSHHLALRIVVYPGGSFGGHLDRVRTLVWEAYKRRLFPVRSTPGVDPGNLYRLRLNYFPRASDVAFDGLDVRSVRCDFESPIVFDMSWYLLDYPDRLHALAAYSRTACSQPGVRRVLGRFLCLMRDALASPEARLIDLTADVGR